MKFLVNAFYGRHRMTAYLRISGYEVNVKRVRRLMALMGIQALYPKPRTSVAHPDHRVYPYLLRDLRVTHPQSGLEYQHHLHPDGQRIYVLGGNSGLVLPLCGRLGAIK